MKLVYIYYDVFCCFNILTFFQKNYSGIIELS